jgi:ABC-type antimicrobial peptide transport system permease subunit
VGALALGALAEAALFGLTGRAPAVIGAAAVTLAAVILVASRVPTWRASRNPPLKALRYE